jgi:hypothetical protein
MSYNITLTNGSLFAVIPDGTINNQSSMTLIGRNYAGGYGEFQDDNFIRLLESNANNVAPSAPLTGQLWYNTSTKTLQVYNGTQFKSISGATSSATAPTNNQTGDLWYNTTTDQLEVWNGSTWVVIGPSIPGTSGAIPAILYDSANTAHSVLELTSGPTTVGIVSQDSVFAPYPALSGFANVYPGITISSAIANAIVAGTSTNSQALNGVPAAGYMSSLVNTQTYGTLSIVNNSGLAVGLNNNFTANVITGNGTVALQNNTNLGNINIGTNKNGNKAPDIVINGTTGNVTIAGNLTVGGTTTTVNTEIINTSEVVTGSLTAGNITSNTSVTANTVMSNTIVSTSVVGNTVLANTVTATSVVGNVVAAPVFNTASWTITESSGKLIFQLLGNSQTIASLDQSGNFTTIGNVTAFGTP